MIFKPFRAGFTYGVALPGLLSCLLTAGYADDNEKRDAPSALSATSPVNLHYAVFVHGLHAMDADGVYALHSWGYEGTAHLYTTGLANWFLAIDITTSVKGRFSDGKVLPISYDGKSFSHGIQRHVHLSFDHNGPHIDMLEPHDHKRDPLPEDQLRTSIDLLSALGLLFHTLDTTGTCNLSDTVFDGLRLTHVEARGPKADPIPKGKNTYYSGPAMRCDFTGQQTAGFVKGSHNRALLAAPQPGVAWFRHVDGIGIVPVRIDFQHPKAGHVVMVMQTSPSRTTVIMDQLPASH